MRGQIAEVKTILQKSDAVGHLQERTFPRTNESHHDGLLDLSSHQRNSQRLQRGASGHWAGADCAGQDRRAPGCDAHGLCNFSVHFRGTGWSRPVYFTILTTHTILAVVIVPMVLITLSRALRGKFDRHRAIARWTFPLWLYVSVTGVVVYVMLYRVFV